MAIIDTAGFTLQAGELVKKESFSIIHHGGSPPLAKIGRRNNLAMMISNLPNQQETPASWAAWYTQAFAKTITFYSGSGLALPRLENACLNSPTTRDQIAHQYDQSPGGLVRRNR